MLVERIKAIKNRIFFFLQSISDTLNVSIKNEENLLQELRARTDYTNKRVDRMLDELRSYADGIMPVRDRYSSQASETEYLLTNPEVALMQHLRSFLSSRNVLDIGANTGDVSHHLLNAGYKVYAFEPNPQTFERLNQRLGHNDEFSAFALALGSDNCAQQLHTVERSTGDGVPIEGDLSVYASLVKHPMPGNLCFKEAVEVDVRRLASLHETKMIPEEISIVKIDTEGNDLQVIAGMGERRYPVVITEFWDASHFFSQGKIGLLKDSVDVMRARGYYWHIVVYRVYNDERNSEPRFYCNLNDAVENSWGNIIFFESLELFQESRRWCAANLPANSTFR